MEVPMVIGIGGVIRNSNHPTEILKGAVYDYTKPECTKPKKPKFFLDKKYIFASMGLLSSVDVELAFELLDKETINICQ